MSPFGMKQFEFITLRVSVQVILVHKCDPASELLQPNVRPNWTVPWKRVFRRILFIRMVSAPEVTVHAEMQDGRKEWAKVPCSQNARVWDKICARAHIWRLLLESVLRTGRFKCNASDVSGAVSREPKLLQEGRTLEGWMAADHPRTTRPTVCSSAMPPREPARSILHRMPDARLTRDGSRHLHN